MSSALLPISCTCNRVTAAQANYPIKTAKNESTKMGTSSFSNDVVRYASTAQTKPPNAHTMDTAVQILAVVVVQERAAAFNGKGFVG